MKKKVYSCRVSFITSRLDYGNSPFAGLPTSTPPQACTKLPIFFYIAVVNLIYNILCDLHWLPNSLLSPLQYFRSDFKMFHITYKTPHSLFPDYPSPPHPPYAATITNSFIFVLSSTCPSGSLFSHG